MPSLNDILAVILGGGRGSRLYPLTKLRSKPAVPIAGKYRLIDVPISNCINSGIYRIAVLTQFNSVSLHRHISRTYHFDTFHHGWVQIWAAEQTLLSADWYQGTADAVRKQTFEIRSTKAPNVLILAGDHLYRMDYATMAEFHWQTDADVTVAVQSVPQQEASRFGILKREQDHRITSFVEKPKDSHILEKFKSSGDPERPYLGSMGIYLFKTEVLLDMLANEDYEDFGGDLIPNAIQSHKVYGFDFDGYWEDIGTIASFYETNLALTLPDARFNFYDPTRPIYTDKRYLPGSVVEDSSLKRVLLTEGCRIQQAEIVHSIVGLRSQIFHDAVIKDSILMGTDFYDTPDASKAAGVPFGIGVGSYIEGAIIDKNVRIGPNVVIRPFPRGTEIENETWFVRDGIVVIPKDTIVPANTFIGPEK